MKGLFLAVALTVTAVSLTLGAAPLRAETDAYRLNPGDVLLVSVWKEEAMEREVLVLPDGTISFPLAGHMMAAGETPEALKGALYDRLRTYYPDPVVTVSVLSVGGNKVFVMGEVKTPGEFAAAQPIDVVQALSLAGGFTEFAAEGQIQVLRREGGKQTALAVDYPKIQSGKNLETNIVLKSGDVVMVPAQGLF